MRKHYVIAGERLDYNAGEPYYHVCCSCHLVHLVIFSKATTMTSYRDEYRTKLLRRKNVRRKKKTR